MSTPGSMVQRGADATVKWLLMTYRDAVPETLPGGIFGQRPALDVDTRCAARVTEDIVIREVLHQGPVRIHGYGCLERNATERH